MSHNYPYRPPPSNSDLRPDPRAAGSSGRHRTAGDIYGPPRESFSAPPHPPSSFSSRGAPWSQDGALGILDSCGLEPADLALLAELPEDVLTVESLPRVLKQIKGKRGTVKPFSSDSPSYSSSSSYASSSSRRPAAAGRDHPRGQLLQYPLGQVTPGPLSSELDRWGNPRICTSVRKELPSLLSISSFEVDYNYRPGPSDNGKMGRDSGQVSSQDLNRRPGPSDYGKTGRDASPVFSQDYNHRPGPSDYGKKARDTSPVFSQDYNHRAGPSDYGNNGRVTSLMFSQDYNHRPGPSDYGKTGRDAGPLSSQDYSYRPGPSHYDASPVPSQDYNHRPGPSDYGQMGRDSGPMLSQDYNHGTGPSRYGKTGRDTDPAPSQDRPSFSSAGRTNRTRASRFSQPEPAGLMQAPHPEEHHPKTRVPRCESGNSSSIGSSQPNAAAAAASLSFPSKKEALDFHGTSPPGFPYSCSLCDITVMSEKVSTPVVLLNDRSLQSDGGGGGAHPVLPPGPREEESLTVLLFFLSLPSLGFSSLAACLLNTENNTCYTSH